MEYYLGTNRNGFPRWLSGKESTCNAGGVGLIPGSGRSPGGGHDNPLQYSCLENLTDRGACQATVHRAAKSQTGLNRRHAHTKKNKTTPYVVTRKVFEDTGLSKKKAKKTRTLCMVQTLCWKKKNLYQNFPGGPMVNKTLCFQGRGAQVQSLVRELRSHMPYSLAKKYV